MQQVSLVIFSLSWKGAHQDLLALVRDDNPFMSWVTWLSGLSWRLQQKSSFIKNTGFKDVCEFLVPRYQEEDKSSRIVKSSDVIKDDIVAEPSDIEIADVSNGN